MLILCSNQTLDFVAAPALAPPEVEVDPALIAKYENELREAAAQPLPDEVRLPLRQDIHADHYRMTPTFKLCIFCSRQVMNFLAFNWLCWLSSFSGHFDFQIGDMPLWESFLDCAHLCELASSGRSTLLPVGLVQ
jgi:hypothetical protein